MRVTADQLSQFGVDGMLVHAIDTAFFMSNPARVGIAVSGGGDSMALLHAAHRWSGLSGVPIAAVTVNHGLRDEAAHEAAMVGAICADWGIAHSVLDWDGRAAKGNLAAAARDARYGLIAKWAKGAKVQGVLLGHTADDVAETFLMRLARKSGVDGLSIMDTRFDRGGVTWARPFWQQHRAELRDYLRRQNVAWVDDPSNTDSRYDRPKAREILTALAPLGITADTLKSVALAQRSARDALEHYTHIEASKHASMEAGDVILKRRTPVPHEVQRRLWLAALRYIGDRAYAPREFAVDELQWRLHEKGKATLAGCIVTQDNHQVRFARELKPVANLICTTDHIWDARWQLDGPHAPDLTIRALAKAIKDVPDWRETGLPRASLMASPAVFDGERLISAPVAGLQNGWDARIVSDFHSFLVCR